MEIRFVIIAFLVVFIVYASFIVLNYLSKQNKKNNFFSLPIFLICISILARVGFSYYKININDNYLDTIVYVVIFLSLTNILDSLFMKTFVEKRKIMMPKLIHNIFIGIIYFVTFFLALKMGLGIDLTALLTTSAVISMVVGLALQETLSNFIAGIVIHIERPFKFSDWVLIDGVEGKVIEINWRTTKILTFDNDFLVIPNSNIVKNSIINFNYPTTNHIICMYVGTSYDIEPTRVKDVLLDVINKNEKILKTPHPEIRVVKYNDFSIDYEIRIWINNFGMKKVLEDELMAAIWYAFKRNKIKIPYPIREVHHYNYERHEEEYIENKEKEEKFKVIKAVKLFENLEDEILLKITGSTQKKMYGKSEKIFYEGDTGDSFFIIIKGKVNVLKNKKVAAILSGGSFFGEMSLFTGEIRTATVEAATDVELLVVDKEGFSKLLMENVEIAEVISNSIAKREFENEQRKKGSDNKIGKSLVIRQEEKRKNILNMIKNVFNL